MLGSFEHLGVIVTLMEKELVLGLKIFCKINEVQHVDIYSSCYNNDEQEKE